MSEPIVKPEDQMFPASLRSSGQVLSPALQATGVARARVGDERPQVSEKFLQDLVEACASNIALLNESGAILYASRAWTIFEQNHRFTRTQNQPPTYFSFYRREQDPNQTNRLDRPTLKDDLDQLLADNIREVNGKYTYISITGTHSVLVHAARLDLPGERFRILVSHDDFVTPREALRKSEERLSQLLE